MASLSGINIHIMQKKTINIFVTLLENIVVTEASTTLDTIGRSPDTTLLVKYMHAKLGLEHDQEYEFVKKLSWSEIKSNNRWGSSSKNWVLVQGEQGVAAIAATESYNAIAVIDGEVVQKNSDRGGTVIDWIKGYIGKIKGYYVGKDTGETRKKKKERQGRKPLPTEQYTDINNFVAILLKKFKPLWTRSIEAAQADIKGFLGTQIKNNAYDKADKKLARLKYLENMLRQLEDGKDPLNRSSSYDDPFQMMRNALHNAVLMTAHHYYPDSTRGFVDRARTYGRSSTHSLVNPDPVSKLFNDIREGDTAKLGTLLGFFKKGLISG